MQCVEFADQPADAEFPSPHAQGYFKLPDGTVVDATDWNPSWGWASGSMISTLDDMRVWARDLAIGKLLSPAMKRERDQFLPAPAEGEGALYGLAIENQNGWIGHNGNIMSYMAYPLPPPGRGDHDGGAVELGRRRPGVVDNDARHHSDHQP